MLHFFKHITVEPSLFVFLIVYDWMKCFDSNLFLQKKCRFNTTLEPDLSTKCEDEKEGILFVTEINAKYQLIIIFSSMLITIFATSWSDEAGRRRRPLIYLAILGQIFHTISGCLNSYFWRWSPMATIIPWTVFESISGGICLMILACQVYVCDISDTDNRTLRLGLVGAVKLICMILGRGGGGFILHSFGFFYSYLICFILSIIGLTFGLSFIKDTSTPVEKKMEIRQMLNLKHMLVDSFRVVFNKSLGRKRITVTLLLIVNVAVVFTFFGELSVSYQYLRYRFGLDEQEYSKYLFYRFSGSALGMLFCSVVLSKCFKIHDGLIGILAGVFDTIAVVGLLLANQIWQVMLIPVIDLFHGTAMTVCISFISKYYSPNELGRLVAVNGVFSLIVPFAFPVYNITYEKTLDTFPAAFCLLSVVLDIGIVLCYCWSYLCFKKFDEEKPKGVEEEIRGMLTPTQRDDALNCVK